jgi:Ring finger domain
MIWCCLTDLHLRTQRHNSTDSLRPDRQKVSNHEEGRRITGRLQKEVYNSSKKGMKKFISWRKLVGSKASDLESVECAVCLEEFKTGEVLAHLPCAHRFHSSCVVPWLESNSHCPVCRTTVCTGIWYLPGSSTGIEVWTLYQGLVFYDKKWVSAFYLIGKQWRIKFTQMCLFFFRMERKISALVWI